VKGRILAGRVQKSPEPWYKAMNSTSYGWLARRMPFSWGNGIPITTHPLPAS
jgi:hypothetical protein